MIYLVIYGVWNIVVALLYGVDKLKAKRNSWRISESCLLIVALLMGALGAVCGMQLFRHKTKTPKFKFGVPALLIVNAAMAWAVYTFLM